MANQLYGRGRQAFGDGDIDWSSDTIYVTLIDAADYVLGGNIDIHR